MKIVLAATVLFFIIGCSSEPETKSMNMEKFPFNADAIEKLIELQEQTKFGEEELYVGLLPKEDQPLANNILNRSIDHLIDILKKNPTKETILN